MLKAFSHNENHSKSIKGRHVFTVYLYISDSQLCTSLQSKLMCKLTISEMKVCYDTHVCVDSYISSPLMAIIATCSCRRYPSNIDFPYSQIVDHCMKGYQYIMAMLTTVSSTCDGALQSSPNLSFEGVYD